MLLYVFDDAPTVSAIPAIGRVLTLRLLMSYIYIYGAPILDVSR